MLDLAMASRFTIYSINQISDLLYQISDMLYISYRIQDILFTKEDLICLIK